MKRSAIVVLPTTLALLAGFAPGCASSSGKPRTWAESVEIARRKAEQGEPIVLKQPLPPGPASSPALSETEAPPPIVQRPTDQPYVPPTVATRPPAPAQPEPSQPAPAAPAAPAASARAAATSDSPMVDLPESDPALPKPATPDSPASGLKPVATPVPTGQDPITLPISRLDQIGVSQLRERAIAQIETSARSPEPTLSANAIEVAALAPKRLSKVIAGGLKDNSAGVRAVTLMAIGKYRLEEHADDAAPLQSDPSPYVQAAAIYALVRCDRNADQSPLWPILSSHESPRARAHVAYILGELGNASALPLLRRTAADRSVDRLPKATLAEISIMQLQIAEAMVKLGENDQLEAIRAALYPARPEEFESAVLAVQIIGNVKDRRATDQLVYLSGYKDKTGAMMPAELRLQIASTLAQLGLDRGGFIADEYRSAQDPLLRAQAAMTYGDTGRPEHLPKLEELLRDPVEVVRLGAAGGVLKITEGAGR